jgi:hypothetical protein
MAPLTCSPPSPHCRADRSADAPDRKSWRFACAATSDPNHLLGRQHGYLSKVNWGDKNEANRWGSIECSPAGQA